MMMPEDRVFSLRYENIWIIPTLHYNMETAAAVCRAFHEIDPDCVAVELPETMQETFLRAAGRLPDISVVITWSGSASPLYFLAEPCDASFEGLRCALEKNRAAYCIDLDVDGYPDIHEYLPDPYAITRIGLKTYWQAYQSIAITSPRASHFDESREMHMARRLKELSLRHDKVLFICGMAHAARILGLLNKSSFTETRHCVREACALCTLTEESCHQILPEGGYLCAGYEESRVHYLNKSKEAFPPDRRGLLLSLYKRSAQSYIHEQKSDFPGYNLRNLMKFVRNYALIADRLTPTLYQILTAAKACVHNNYAYEVWKIATAYPYLKNLDNLDEMDLTPGDVWGHSQSIHFKLMQKNEKGSFFQRLKRDKKNYKLEPSGGMGFCSFQPEDIAIESFGSFLKKKGTQVLLEEGSRTIPFSASLEDGIDTRETIRHWVERKLYVRTKGRPPGDVGSIVIIFDEDKQDENRSKEEKYPWCVTWHGEHAQESDMSFYATPFGKEIIGPGICRCEYGGFMLTYPPRRVLDIWSDPDYFPCRNKAEVLLAAAIDYSVSPNIVYAAPTPPRPLIKSYANRYGKRVIYLPVGQLSPVRLNRLRKFHVLDSHARRAIADDYIF